MEYAEITREAFDACSRYSTLLHLASLPTKALKAYYYCHGMELLKIDNYLSCTTQFYILDINA